MPHYNFNDCKPVGSYTKKELIDLNHKYRLLLKKSGFEDIEKWDNNPHQKSKRLKFHKITVRYRGLSYKAFEHKTNIRTQYFRAIGLYANHCSTVPTKYRAILQDYAITGNLAESVRNVNSGIKFGTVGDYLRYNMKNILKFVREEFSDE